MKKSEQAGRPKQMGRKIISKLNTIQTMNLSGDCNLENWSESMVQQQVSRRMFLSSTAMGSVGAGLSLAKVASAAEDPVRYPDERIKSLDPRFDKYKIGNTSIQRIYTNPRALWHEGCAWNAAGRYLVFSDVPRNTQLRWIEDDDRVTEFRKPSGNTNGNTFDYQGRLLSCQQGNRRIVRYEHDGSVTVIAAEFEGKPLNSPNDVVVNKQDASIWFTDPAYGARKNYAGKKGPVHLPESVYRVDAQSGQIAKVTDDIGRPNGLCFSPDLSKLYISDTGDGAHAIKVWDVDGQSLKNGRQFTSMKMDGFDKVGMSDGIRADFDGNIWSSAGWVGQGYDGVHVFAPNGDRIGLIALPEMCANLCFGGEKRTRLFMVASQSLYAVYTEAVGAHAT